MALRLDQPQAPLSLLIMTGVPGVSILLLALRALSLSPQALSDTSGWALRIQRNCPAGQSECGPTANGFVACCPASSPCMNQYNDVCCPPGKSPALDRSIRVGPHSADLADTSPAFEAPTAPTLWWKRDHSAPIRPGCSATTMDTSAVYRAKSATALVIPIAAKLPATSPLPMKTG